MTTRPSDAASLAAVPGHWAVEPGGEDHNPWVALNGQRVAECWGPNDDGDLELAETIAAALNRDDPADDDAWSAGYDEGFAAAKRLCDALDRASLRAEAPTPLDTLDVERLARAIAVESGSGRFEGLPVERLGYQSLTFAAFIAEHYAAASPAAEEADDAS